MVQEVALPEISENVESGEVIRVLVSEGQTIEQEQPVVELETEKAAFEVPSTAAGKVVEIAIAEGDTVRVGQILIKVETGQEAKEPEEKTKKEERTEEDRQKAGREKKEAAAEEKKAAAQPETEEAEQQERERGGPEREAPGAAEQKEVAPASPSVRRLARELGVDIESVSGSGPAGRISHDDVKRHVKEALRGQRAAGTPEELPALPDFSRWGEIERKPMSPVRKATARNTAAAWRAIPHVTQFDQAGLEAVERFRERYAKRVSRAGGKLTITAIMLKVAAAALKIFPQLNASLDAAGGEIIYKRYIHIGVAVDTDRGLLVPVIRDVDRKDITQVAVELTELAERTRTKKVKPAELEGASFTVSNLGGIGGTGFTPIVYYPQVAILGVARARREIYLQQEGIPAERSVLPLSLSYDHRVVDGADGARFLRWIADVLENPLLLLMEGGL
jgi:pyruvate dehydrogenase E2 component (dihydrolipoamide acetyltransferase)